MTPDRVRPREMAFYETQSSQNTSLEWQIKMFLPDSPPGCFGGLYQIKGKNLVCIVYKFNLVQLVRFKIKWSYKA